MVARLSFLLFENLSAEDQLLVRLNPITSADLKGQILQHPVAYNDPFKKDLHHFYESHGTKLFYERSALGLPPGCDSAVDNY